MANYAPVTAVQLLPKTRLVVLAACGSGDPQSGRDGVVNLATAFVEAGVPTVVATLWNAEDGTSARVMAAFHRHLRGSGPAAALAAATREICRADPSYPVTLGGITVIGGAPELLRNK